MFKLSCTDSANWALARFFKVFGTPEDDRCIDTGVFQQGTSCTSWCLLAANPRRSIPKSLVCRLGSGTVRVGSPTAHRNHGVRSAGLLVRLRAWSAALRCARTKTSFQLRLVMQELIFPRRPCQPRPPGGFQAQRLRGALFGAHRTWRRSWASVMQEFAPLGPRQPLVSRQQIVRVSGHIRDPDGIEKGKEIGWQMHYVAWVQIVLPWATRNRRSSLPGEIAAVVTITKCCGIGVSRTNQPSISLQHAINCTTSGHQPSWFHFSDTAPFLSELYELLLPWRHGSTLGQAHR